MEAVVTISGGFAEVESGRWLMGRGQPAAFLGTAVRRRRKGWRVRDRSSLDLVEVGSPNPGAAGMAKCADSSRPFLTHIPCAAPVFAVSDKVLVAPAAARRDAQFVKVVPMSLSSSICVTEFGVPGDGEAPRGDAEASGGDSAWVVMATESRTCRLPLEDGQTLSARPDAVVAWTTKRPTGFCPRLSVWDVLLPRGPRDLMLTFYGPGVVWVEGSAGHQSCRASTRRPAGFSRRCHGV